MGVSITVLPDGRVNLNIRYKGRRFCKRVEGKQKDALKRARDLKGKIEARMKLRQPIFDKDESRSVTLAEYFKNGYQRKLRTLSPKTQVSMDQDFRVHIEPDLGDKHLSEITRGDVKAFIDRLKRKTYGKGKDKPKRSYAKDSIRLIIATLRAILSEAMDDEIIASNPAARQGKNYKELQKTHEISPLTDEELRTYLEAAASTAPFYFPLFSFLLHAGTRVSEALNLRWADVDLLRRVVHIRKSKTGRTRQIELSHFMVSVLTELQVSRQQQFGALPEFVFCSSAGTQMDADNLRNQEHKRVLKSAKMRHIRIHDLRHTFATLHLQNGSPLEWVSKQLGHASVKMTVDVYYHYLPSPSGSGFANKLPAIETAIAGNLIKFNVK